MAASIESANLPELFNGSWAIYTYLDTCDDPTSSDKVQDQVSSGIGLCERAIRMINDLELFSKNEDIEDVTTNEIRYMLLSALLGYLTQKNTRQDRIEVINKSQEYYVDFLQLCRLYGVTSLDVPGTDSNDKQSSNFATESGPPPLDVMAKERQSKIERYKQQKETENKVNDLYKEVQKEHVDDEVKREYYVTLLKKWVNTCIEEIDSIKSEIQILQYMGRLGQGDGDKRPTKPTTKPFRPFILTKDVLQKQVFGLGYPSMPTMTIEEFYEQKVKEGSIQPGSTGSNLQDFAQDPDKKKEEDEAELGRKEDLEERDDPDTIRAARDKNDWKDDNRRGWGNRQNMG